MKKKAPKMTKRKIKLSVASFILAMSTVLGACGIAAGSDSENDGAQNESADSTDASNENELSIAATSVAIVEILDRLEYDNVVGIPEAETQLPERYEGVETIGQPMTPDMEILASIAPDLVLSPVSLESSLSEEYIAAGLNSAFLDLNSVEGMYSAIESLGELLGRQEQAQALIDEYNDYMSDYEVESEEEISVLLLMCFPDGFYLVSTEKSYVGNLVELAGGYNVYTEYEGDTSGFVSINPEDMVQRQPDKILVYSHYSEEAAFAYMEDEFATNTTWQYYDAVVNGEIYYLPRSYFNMSASLTWTDSLDYLRPVLYGDDA